MTNRNPARAAMWRALKILAALGALGGLGPPVAKPEPRKGPPLLSLTLPPETLAKLNSQAPRT